MANYHEGKLAITDLDADGPLPEAKEKAMQSPDDLEEPLMEPAEGTKTDQDREAFHDPRLAEQPLQEPAEGATDDVDNVPGADHAS